MTYDEAVATCKDVFLEKTKDFGQTWRILRLSSITDKILVKAWRIRRLDELKGANKISEKQDVEYIGIANYSVMALIKLVFPDHLWGVDDASLSAQFDIVTGCDKFLMEQKNHDYNSAWREMRLSSMLDQILVKISRVKQIEDNHTHDGLIHEYFDILNWAIFALMRLSGGEQNG